MDRVVCAEVPVDLETLPQGSNIKEIQRQEDVVVKNMVYSCSSQGKDNNGFPKPSADATAWDEGAFYSQY